MKSMKAKWQKRQDLFTLDETASSKQVQPSKGHRLGFGIAGKTRVWQERADGAQRVCRLSTLFRNKELPDSPGNQVATECTIKFGLSPILNLLEHFQTCTRIARVLNRKAGH